MKEQTLVELLQKTGDRTELRYYYGADAGKRACEAVLVFGSSFFSPEYWRLKDYRVAFSLSGPSLLLVRIPEE